jgi:endoglucanase
MIPLRRLSMRWILGLTAFIAFGGELLFYAAMALGGGPTLLVYDARMIPNLKLRDMVLEAAEAAGVTMQFSAIEGGATDGGVIHLYKTGVPTIVMAVPARHIHSHSSIIHRKDYEDAVKVLVELVSRLGKAEVEALTV